MNKILKKILVARPLLRLPKGIFKDRILLKALHKDELNQKL